ncbi:MAG: transcriptional repressor [Oscillospiraceae bacterium]|nr:transcriptional repressor [Oscillospiraceae bacterium]
METTTKQFRKRNAILECLRMTDTHPSADMVHEMLKAGHPDISLATVYRNLSLFKAQGIIQSLGMIHGIERFDGNTEPHVHFVCNCCTAVQDLHQMDAPQRLCGEAAQHIGGQVDACQLMFFGTCRACLAKNQSA